jgi:hypothetical protein
VPLKVGVTVKEVVPASTDALYLVVPELNVGDNEPERDEKERSESDATDAFVKAIELGPAMKPPAGRIEIVAEVAARFVGAGTAKSNWVSDAFVRVVIKVKFPALGVQITVASVSPAPVTVITSPPPT